jgi:hypothetical protein
MASNLAWVRSRMSAQARRKAREQADRDGADQVHTEQVVDQAEFKFDPTVWPD